MSCVFLKVFGAGDEQNDARSDTDDQGGDDNIQAGREVSGALLPSLSAGGGEADRRSGGRVEEPPEECVICLTDPKDTLLLPCRHLCVCSECFRHVSVFAIRVSAVNDDSLKKPSSFISFYSPLYMNCLFFAANSLEEVLNSLSVKPRHCSRLLFRYLPPSDPFIGGFVFYTHLWNYCSLCLLYTDTRGNYPLLGSDLILGNQQIQRTVLRHALVREVSSGRFFEYKLEQCS